MKKLLTVLMVFVGPILYGQTVYEDSVNKFSYVKISPVVWQYGQDMCNRLYITNYTGDLNTTASVTANVGYMPAPNSWARFVAPSISYVFYGAQYDSVKTYGKEYIFSTVARSKGLVITE